MSRWCLIGFDLGNKWVQSMPWSLFHIFGPFLSRFCSMAECHHHCHQRVPSLGVVYLVWNSVGQQNIALYRDEQCYSFHQLALSMMWLIMHTCVWRVQSSIGTIVGLSQILAMLGLKCWVKPSRASPDRCKGVHAERTDTCVLNSCIVLTARNTLLYSIAPDCITFKVLIW